MSFKKDEVIECPCCGKTMVEEYDICEECGWQNDWQQRENPDMTGGANRMSLNQARDAWKRGTSIR